MPAFSTGTEPITDSVQGANASPTPTPITTKAGRAWAYPPWTVVNESIANPAATRPMPVKTTGFVPNFRSRRMDSGAATRSSTAIGAMRSPVSKAL